MSKIDNIDEFIQYTKDYSAANPYWSVQVNLTDENLHRAFHETLIYLADEYRFDILTGYQRKAFDIKVGDMLELIDKSDFIFSGIKIVHKPIARINEWEKWEDGYVEGFCRFSCGDSPDYFIWTYLKTEHLRTILEEFKEDLEYYE